MGDDWIWMHSRYWLLDGGKRIARFEGVAKNITQHRSMNTADHILRGSSSGNDDHV